MRLAFFLLLGLLPVSVFSGLAHADFREGVAAYRAGDHAKAARIWQADAENGDPAAQRNLGLLYLNGLGVPQDPVEAASWFRRAAEQSFAPAAANLADLYLRGVGVPRDRRKSAEYMRIAADGGIAEAQHNLGVLYEHGFGLEKDQHAAVFWYQRAAASGYQKSIDRLAVLRPVRRDTAPEQPAAPAVDDVRQDTPTRTVAVPAPPRDPDGSGLVDRLVPLFSKAD
ncbi:tetratricopeptide repeat protein [Minwuia sp.]|uniref:tetratricopeptide repeat protein n=1 Tax=Minwuia sp. TaxID=2493630 RepID=UPI003A8CF862